MHCMHRLIITFSVFVLAAIQPAVAQFEVSPDHFDQVRIVPTPQSARAEEKLKQSITEEMALLKSYTEQIAEKERQVEDLRQQAISAGISGDGAAMEIAWFRNRQEELITFRTSLAPLINYSREVLAGLYNDLDMVQGGSGSVSGARRSSKSLQASARTGR
jgi:hypothetical protein